MIYWICIKRTNHLYSYTIEKLSTGSDNHDSDAMVNDQPIVTEEDMVLRRGNNPVFMIVSFSYSLKPLLPFYFYI